jgi:hemerythrin-like domain-containing protein
MSEALGPLTMNRLIHNAVRRDLGRLGDALAAFPDGDPTRAADLLRAFRNLLRELTEHHVGEDTHIWPLLAELGVDPALLSAMESEHEEMAQALAATEAALERLAGDATPEAAQAAARQVATLTEVVERHLSHEESDLEPALHPYVETPEWKAVEKKLRGRSAGDAGLFFAWLTDGMPQADRDFLGTLVPRPVTFLLPRLLGRRYTREVAPVWTSGG